MRVGRGWGGGSGDEGMEGCLQAVTGEEHCTLIRRGVSTEQVGVFVVVVVVVVAFLS